MLTIRRANLLTFRGFLLSGFAVFVALALVFSHSFMQADSRAAVTASRAEHIMVGTETDGDRASHVMSQDCLMSCTFRAVTATEFALVFVLDRSNSQNRSWDADVVALFRPEMPERPPQSV
jgi:hypothetical protein